MKMISFFTNWGITFCNQNNHPGHDKLHYNVINIHMHPQEKLLAKKNSNSSSFMYFFIYFLTIHKSKGLIQVLANIVKKHNYKNPTLDFNVENIKKKMYPKK